MDEVGLGKTLQLARLSKGLTQQQLCQRANLSYSTLAKIERGAIKAPSIFTIQKIADTLNVSLGDLLGNVSDGKQKTNRKFSTSGISFVYLDIHGCLVSFYQRAFTKIAQEYSVSSEKVESIFWHLNDAVCIGDLSVSDFNLKLAEELGIEKIDYLSYYLSSVEPVTGMFELVSQIASNYRVGLISNIMPGFIDALRSHNLIPDVIYNSVVDSSVVKILKPERKIFEIAEKMSSVGPNEILLIDDSRNNLIAVDQMKWHAIWFNDNDPEDSILRIKSALDL